MTAAAQNTVDQDMDLYSLLADTPGDWDRRSAGLVWAALSADYLGERFASRGRTVRLFGDVRRALAARASVLSGRTVGVHHNLYVFRRAGGARLVPRQTQ